MYYREGCNRFAFLYDPLVRSILFPFGGEEKLRKRIVEALEIREGERVVDIACGTGTLARIIGARAWVAGVDLSENMLRIAREKAPTLALQRADSGFLPFQEGSFDKAVISFALHEMPRERRKNTLSETCRVLKPGARAAFVDYNIPASFLAKAIFRAYMLIETEDAWDLLRCGMREEIERAGFAIEEQDFLIKECVQIIISKTMP
jgi:ubiquinone/menaquinone biosynthesis C-methylase UbiE